MKKPLIYLFATVLSLPFTLFGQPQTLKELRTNTKPQKVKLAPDLEEMLAQDDADDAARLQGKTLAEVRQARLAGKSQGKARAQQTEDSETDTTRRVVNGLLMPSMEVGAEEKQSFIVQVESGTPNVVLQEKLALLGGRIKQQHGQMGLLTIEAPRTAIRQLAAEGSVAYVSPDRAVAASGHLENTTGAALIRATTGYTSMDGTGIGIAVIDSGVDDLHDQFMHSTSGVVYQKDFTGAGSYRDSYGHGSHVASLAAGVDTIWSDNFDGLATNAKIISLRTLDSYGLGTASNVVAALDWCITNKATYNIRVINISLGTNAKDSYKTDPLCLAARRAHNAGIVVVASAGNNGKDLLGRKIYGGIKSPGIEPSVITVGASNTYGTDARSDDTITTYSSRGPTRGYTTVNGVKKYDNLIKPDLVAPGNKLISAAAGHYGGNTLLTLFPSLLAKGIDVDEKMMYLSGTSMAAPVVAGAVAMMLEANPNLTPSLVKAILMYSAQPLAGFNMLEQGAGELNVDGAVRLAKLVKTTLPTANGAALLTASLPTSQTSTIAGQTVKWGQGAITNFGFLYGSALMTNWQSVYASGQVLGDATSYASSTLSLVSGKTSGVSLKSGAVTISSSGVILGDSANAVFASGQVLGDGTILGDGIILGDGVIIGDGIILGDGLVLGDMTLQSTSAFLGDNTACMKPLP